MELRSHPHCVFNIKAHLILVTAYRRPVLTDGLLAELERHVQRVCAQAEVGLLEFHGEADQVHLLLELHPNIQPSKLVNSIKTMRSRMIRRDHWREVRKMLWGGRFWSRSYCWISAGGGATTAIIKRYIQGQAGLTAGALSIHAQSSRLDVEFRAELLNEAVGGKGHLYNTGQRLSGYPERDDQVSVSQVIAKPGLTMILFFGLPASASLN